MGLLWCSSTPRKCLSVIDVTDHGAQYHCRMTCINRILKKREGRSYHSSNSRKNERGDLIIPLIVGRATSSRVWTRITTCRVSPPNAVRTHPLPQQPGLRDPVLMLYRIVVCMRHFFLCSPKRVNMNCFELRNSATLHRSPLRRHIFQATRPVHLIRTPCIIQDAHRSSPKRGKCYFF